MGEAVFKALIDTSIYIPFINRAITHPVLKFGDMTPLLYMSAVVMEELYAGAFDKTSIRVLDRLFKTFDQLGRIVTPDYSDWQQAGKIIAKLGKKYGFEEVYLSHLLNDILIALSARRVGATLFTNNQKDYSRLREYVDFKIAS